jgi:elongation factor Ts
VIEQERAAYRAEALEEGKPEHILDRIVEGKISKFYKEACLMGQPFVKNEDKTIQELIDDTLAKLGEKIVLRRFVRYELGKE